MKDTGALAILILAVGIAAPGPGSPSPESRRQSDVWDITVAAKSHPHSPGATSSAREKVLNEDVVTYRLDLTERLHGSELDSQLDLGEDAVVVADPVASGIATEVSHTRHAVMNDLQEQWLERKGALDALPAGAAAHFAGDSKAHQGLFEATAHYTARKPPAPV